MSRDVKVGDKIMVTEVNGKVLDVPHLTEITAVDNPDYGDWIDIKHAINGESCLYNDDGEDGDRWYPLGEFVSKELGNDTETPPQKHREEETLQHRQAHAYYDDEALSPTYSDAVKSGMTFAEYTGVNITEESLDFEPKEEEVLRGITAESLNFEEAPKSDAVNHPSHYNYGDIEVIDVLEMLSGSYDDSTEAYLIATAAKYLFRADHKKNKVEDWEKAVWYLRRAIERGGDLE